MKKALLFLALFACVVARSQAQTAFAMAADKMNVLYVGIENPFSIAVEGIRAEDIELVDTSGNVRISPSGAAGKFVLLPQSSGITRLKIRHKSSKKVLGEQDFRVRPIPDPIVKISNGGGSAFGTGAVDRQQGLIAELPNFDFEAKCEVISYTLFYTKRNQDPAQITGRGGRFEGQVQAAVRAAGIGDVYNFTDIQVRCPGDVRTRTAEPIVINIR